MTALQQTKDPEHTNAHALIHSAHMLTQRKQRHVHRQAQGDISSYQTQRRQGLFWLFHSALDLRYTSVHSASRLSPNLLVHNTQTDLQMNRILVPLPVTALNEPIIHLLGQIPSKTGQLLEMTTRIMENPSEIDYLEELQIYIF